MVHTINLRAREDIKQETGLGIILRFLEAGWPFSEPVAGCFAYLVFRLNPSICLSVFINHARDPKALSKCRKARTGDGRLLLSR